MRTMLLSVFALFGVGCSPLDSATSNYIELSDADSGYFYTPDEKIHYRLHNVDSPEDRSKNQQGGAKCDAEQVLGDAASAYAATIIEGARLEITARYGLDRWKREVVDISIDGQDMGTLLVEAGHAAWWDYDNGDPKPVWCN